jgi:hypothetical protein
MTDRYPFIPPSALIEKWQHGAFAANDIHMAFYWAARWGADKELEACCELLDGYAVVPLDTGANTAANRLAAIERVGRLRAARRPKPPSLKEQSIALLDKIQSNKQMWQLDELNVVRQALEQLDE